MKQLLIVVITVAPTGKVSFLYSCVQTRLIGQYNGKQPISLVYVSKLQITVIRAVVFLLILFTCISSTGDLTNLDSYTVQPGFEPARIPGTKTCLNSEQKVCVVCGGSESCKMKSLIPYDYRRYFPPEMKSYDFLLICGGCHHLANDYNGQLRKKLAEDYDAPWGMIM